MDQTTLFDQLHDRRVAEVATTLVREARSKTAILHGLGRQGALAEGLARNTGLAAVAHQDDGPGGGDLRPGHLVDIGKTPGVDLAGLGLRRRWRLNLMILGSGGGAVAHPA